ncbi:HAD family hydrolase [Nitrosomonas sp. JL21]|uniref:HAD family hydrolase n=1 Tax=Nitrosomonas sp. JL21 TaxID=153949 RepID=UPI00137174A8|nr:HAD-IA family hydrolase [Nitrosomonas sp. JL21]MBL8498628.1 HAD-IA family hydrolase [Nitrosomonas sp.]MXS77300.1 HAD family hydrolase [Nitrosomonas sp. JL21]
MIEAILFDFDGTLADTAPDLGHALNRQRIARGLPELPIAEIRPLASAGSRGLLGLGFNIKPGDDQYESMRDEFLDFYTQRLCHDTCLFPGIDELLDQLDARELPWGIVTNKPARFTHPLIKILGLTHRVGCVICGDDIVNTKPHPEPLLTASKKMAINPSHCIYLGDDIRDVQASLAAGMQPIIARYGYLGNGQPPETWGAHHLIDHPKDLLAYL